jgi:anti-sigma B factor antagonist
VVFFSDTLNAHLSPGAYPLPIAIDLTNHDDVSTVRIAGMLDATTARELGASFDKLVEERRTRIVIDLAGLELIDSSGVAVLVALYKRVRADGGQVQVINVRNQPLAIFKLLRMDKVFSI